MHKELEAVLACYNALRGEAMEAHRQQAIANRGYLSWAYHGVVNKGSQALGTLYYYAGSDVEPPRQDPAELAVFPVHLTRAQYIAGNLNVSYVFTAADWERDFHNKYFSKDAIAEFESEYTTQLSLLAARLRSGADIEIIELDPFITALSAYCERLYAIEIGLGLLPKITMDEETRKNHLFAMSDLFDILDASRKGLNAQKLDIDPKHELMHKVLALLKILPKSLYATATIMNQRFAPYGVMSKYSEHRVSAAIKEAVKWYQDNKPEDKMDKYKKLVPFSKEPDAEQRFQPLLMRTRESAYELLGAAIQMSSESKDTHFCEALDKIPYFAALGDDLECMGVPLKKTCIDAYNVSNEVNSVLKLASPKG